MHARAKYPENIYKKYEIQLKQNKGQLLKGIMSSINNEEPKIFLEMSNKTKFSNLTYIYDKITNL